MDERGVGKRDQLRGLDLPMLIVVGRGQFLMSEVSLYDP